MSLTTSDDTVTGDLIARVERVGLEQDESGTAPPIELRAREGGGPSS